MNPAARAPSTHPGSVRPAIARALAWSGSLWLGLNVARTYFLDGGTTVHRVEAAAFSFVALLLLARALHPPPLPMPAAEGEPGPAWVILAVAWLLVAWPMLSMPFLSDDFIFLVRFTDWRNVWAGNHLFRPLFNLIFWLLGRLNLAQAFWLHALNMLLHLACAAMVFRLGRRVLRDSWQAVLVAMLFLFNPLQSEAVAWISGIQETLWLLLALLALDFHTRRRQTGFSDIAVASVFFVLALLSKETAVCFIPLALLLDLVCFGWRRNRAWPWPYAAYAVPLAAYLLARSALAVMQPTIMLPTQYEFKSFLSAPYCAFILPWNRICGGAQPLLAGVIGLLLTLGLVAAARRRETVPRMLGGAAVIALATLPLQSWLYIAADLQGSRYLYGPAIGWGVIIAAILGAVVPPRARGAALLTVMALSAWALHANLRSWREAGRIVEDIAVAVRNKKAPAEVPDNYCGAYVLRCGYPELKALQRAK